MTMENKGTILIIIIAIALIAIGIYLIHSGTQTTMDGTANEFELETYALKNFDIKAPKGVNFSENNSNDKMIYYQNVGEHSDEISGIIVNKNLTDTLLGDKITPLSNTSTEKIYVSQVKNNTVYKVVTTKNNIDIILIGQDLNLLKELANTTTIKKDVF